MDPITSRDYHVPTQDSASSVERALTWMLIAVVLTVAFFAGAAYGAQSMANELTDLLPQYFKCEPLK